MKKKILPENSQFQVYQVEDGQIKINVRLEQETFGRRSNRWLICSNLPNRTSAIIFKAFMKEEGELLSEATVKKYLTVRSEGQRDVKRRLDHYSLDMVTSSSPITALGFQSIHHGFFQRFIKGLDMLPNQIRRCGCLIQQALLSWMKSIKNKQSGLLFLNQRN